MHIDMGMSDKETKFTAERWWATAPEFVLFAIERQLIAASAIWPELKECKLVGPSPIDPPAAHLIAAAPEMLSVLDVIRLEMKNRDRSPSEERLYTVIQQTIAKATGAS